MDDSLGSKSNVRMHMAYRGEHVTQFWPDMRSPLKGFQGFTGGSVVKNSPASVGDMSSISDLVKFHMPGST